MIVTRRFQDGYLLVSEELPDAVRGHHQELIVRCQSFLDEFWRRNHAYPLAHSVADRPRERAAGSLCVRRPDTRRVAVIVDLFTQVEPPVLVILHVADQLPGEGTARACDGLVARQTLGEPSAASGRHHRHRHRHGVWSHPYVGWGTRTVGCLFRSMAGRLVGRPYGGASVRWRALTISKLITHPPAALTRSLSSLRYGVWSIDSGNATVRPFFLSPIMQRESPTLAMWMVPATRAEVEASIRG